MALLERALQAVERRMVLLAPPNAAVPDYFERIDFDLDRHSQLLRGIQQFRGSVYLRDGALTRQQLVDGCHETPEDGRSWHLLMLDAKERVAGCAWYIDHDSRVHFDRLRLRQNPLAQSATWHLPLWSAITEEIAQARAAGVRYAEVGGWAVSTECRHTGDALIVALAAYCLGRVRGETLGITTATARHGSASILRRIGGSALSASGVTLPPYYDPRYGCTMEILRFDSRRPSPRFRGVIDRLHAALARVPVVARPYWPITQRARPEAPSPAAWSTLHSAADYGTVSVALQL
jgi:hypothetical protein